MLGPSAGLWMRFWNIRLRAIAQRLVQEKARECWQAYCHTRNDKSKLSKVWRRVKAMSGQRSDRAPPALTINGNKIELPQDCANEFGKHFAAVNSNDNYDESFASTKIFIECISNQRIARACKSQLPTELHIPFTMQDILLSIKSIEKPLALAKMASPMI